MESLRSAAQSVTTRYNHDAHPESFRNKFSLQSRKSEAKRIMEKYPDRRPLIVEKDYRSDVKEINKKKYLVPMDLTIGQFVYVIRKRIQLPSEKAIYIFINNVIPPTSALVSDVYEKNKGEDGFLTVIYSSENTFG
jgi:GABA(A) receptor-associated protein